MARTQDGFPPYLITRQGGERSHHTLLNTRGKITAEDIEIRQVKSKVIFMNACQVSRRDLADAFFKAGKPQRRYYIAPRVDVTFNEAFLVALLFYKKAFLEKRPRLFSALKYVYNLKDVKTNYWLWEGP